MLARLTAMRVLLIHNPSAGKSDHPREELLAMLRLAGHDVDYCSTKSDDFPRMLKEPAELIVIAGGDGTVRKVVTRLKRRETPLAILPLGTANNVARSLGIAGGRQEQVAGWENGRAARLDIGIARWADETRPFIEAVGVGSLAETTDDKVGGKLDGEKRLLAGRARLREQLEQAAPLQVTAEIDGRQLEGSWLIIEVMNNCYTGPGLPLCRRARSGDSALDLVAVSEERREEMLAWLAAPEETEPPVDTSRGAHVRLQWSGTPTLRIDDKRIKMPDGPDAIDIRLQEEPLTVLLPSRTGKVAEGAARQRPLEDA